MNSSYHTLIPVHQLVMYDLLHKSHSPVDSLDCDSKQPQKWHLIESQNNG